MVSRQGAKGSGHAHLSGVEGGGCLQISAIDRGASEIVDGWHWKEAHTCGVAVTWPLRGRYLAHTCGVGGRRMSGNAFDCPFVCVLPRGQPFYVAVTRPLPGSWARTHMKADWSTPEDGGEREGAVTKQGRSRAHRGMRAPLA